MKGRLAHAIGPLLAVLVAALAAAGIARALVRSDRELQEKSATLRSRLEQLAAITPASGTGPAGFEVEAAAADSSVWIELTWEEPQAIDEIIIVPMLNFSSASGRLAADGFPLRLTVEAGGRRPELIASLELTDGEAARPAPHIIRTPVIQTRRLRLTAASLTRRLFDGKRVLQIGEILVLNGDRNLAETAAVLSSTPPSRDGFGVEQVFDGIVPYDLDGPGEGSISYARRFQNHQSVQLTIALPAPAALRRVTFFPKDRSIAIPNQYLPGNGFPIEVKLVAAMLPDFANSTVLIDQPMPPVANANPVNVALPAGTPPAQFLRLHLEPAADPYVANSTLCALAELQLWDDQGRNVGREAVIREALPLHEAPHRLGSLFDGRNRFGTILPMREWLHQLAERQRVEMELAGATHHLEQLDADNRRTLQGILISFGALIIILIATYLIHVTRLKAMALESQELLLAELHDEVGASLHAIRMFAEVAGSAPAAKQPEIVEKIHRLAGDSAESVRRVTHLLDEGLTGDAFVRELARHGKWLPARCAFKLDLQVDEVALAEKPAVSLGHLLRFYHECLANVNRHVSDATEVQVTFTCSRELLALTVTDNGEGMRGAQAPRSLLRRARLARGQLTVSPGSDGHGTTVKITIRPPRWWWPA